LDYFIKTVIIHTCVCDWTHYVSAEVCANMQCVKCIRIVLWSLAQHFGILLCSWCEILLQVV